MAKLSLAELSALLASVVTEAKASNPSFVESHDNIVGLIDKIGKIVTFDTSYLDKLALFDGEDLSFGKTIEEWQQDLQLPESFDADGSGALAPHVPTYRPVSYSYTLGRKVWKTTIPYDNIERAVHFEEQFISITAMIMKRLEDSYIMFKYGLKREALGLLASMCLEAEDVSNATAYAISTAFDVGDVVYGGTSPYETAIVVKPIPATNSKTWAQALEAGLIIKYELSKIVAVPVDATTGENFVKAVKTDIEIASDVSEGHSLNGNTLGASEGLVLLVKQGVIPAVEVDVMAGAFHSEKVALPAELVVVKDFGSQAPSGVYAILMDRRGMRLHNTYRAVREQLNADGDFMNYFRHSEDTVHISRNTFVRIYKAS